MIINKIFLKNLSFDDKVCVELDDIDIGCEF